ncbi:MAG TPA: DMT family transporter [Gemmatimonadales bacterium]|nr:DMT family transporter [Gemmatimonadales bacterium]
MTQRQADALLLAATAIWGVSFVAVKAALAYATPLAFVAVRFALAALAVTPGTRFSPLPSRGELGAALLLTSLLAIGFATQNIGLVYTTPSRSAFIVAISSVLAPPIAFFGLGQRTRWLSVGALALAGFGVYLLTAPDAGGLNRGDLWTLVTAGVFGAQIVAVRELAVRYDARRLVWLQTAGTALAVGLAALLLETSRIRWTPAFTGLLVYCAVFPTAVALLWQMRAQRHMSSARAALIFCFEPLFAAITSWAVLDEQLSAIQWLGGALILGGMVVADLPLSRRLSAVGRQPTS